ncbi:MAG: FAD:protein FMN transferase [Phycisphaerales bacterium]
MQARPDFQVAGTDGLVHRSLQAMGCRFELILDSADSPHDRFSIEAVADELVELIQDWHDRLSIFSPASIASRINTAPAGVPVRVDRDLFELLRLCELLCEETDGAFNISAGTLMHLHGFRGTQDQGVLSSDIDLRHAFTLDNDTLSITRNNDLVSLDFGAIAKGFVLDLIAEELRSYEIRHAFVHGGSSSVLGFGLQDETNPWRVRVSDQPCLNVRLRSTSLGVSEHSGRLNAQHDGHIMDPSTLHPARNSIVRVACTHPSAAIADAYSTALSVRPELIDRLHEHGCSIAMFTSSSEPDSAYLRDRLGVFINPISN